MAQTILNSDNSPEARLARAEKKIEGLQKRVLDLSGGDSGGMPSLPWASLRATTIAGDFTVLDGYLQLTFAAGRGGGLTDRYESNDGSTGGTSSADDHAGTVFIPQFDRDAIGITVSGVYRGTCFARTMEIDGILFISTVSDLTNPDQNYDLIPSGVGAAFAPRDYLTNPQQPNHQKDWTEFTVTDDALSDNDGIVIVTEWEFSFAGGSINYEDADHSLNVYRVSDVGNLPPGGYD